MLFGTMNKLKLLNYFWNFSTHTHIKNVYFVSTWVWIQGLMFAKQAFCHLRHVPNHFLFSSYRSYDFSFTSLRHCFFYLYFLVMWDYRHHFILLCDWLHETETAEGNTAESKSIDKKRPLNLHQISFYVLSLLIFCFCLLLLLTFFVL
jgi:hypothetical protein